MFETSQRPPARICETALAMEGFSATHSIFIALSIHSCRGDKVIWGRHLLDGASGVDCRDALKIDTGVGSKLRILALRTDLPVSREGPAQVSESHIVIPDCYDSSLTA